VRALLEVEGLTVRFGGLVALEGLELTLAPGERVALVGPNGAGKTTALDAIGGQVPAAGRVRLAGHDLSRAAPAARARAGLGRTFQRLGLVPGLSALENVQLGLPSGAEPARASALLERFGVREAAGVGVESLPRAAQRAVALARALAPVPQVILLDEPCAGLEVEAGRRLLQPLLELEPCPAFLLVEHTPALVDAFTMRALALEAGRVVNAPPPAAPPEAALDEPPPAGALRLRLERVAVPAARITGLSLEARAGEIVSVVGPTGVGKSALAAALAAELPYEGRVELDGRALDALDPATRARAGLHYVPADGGLFLSLTVQDNLRLCGADPTPAFELFPVLSARRRQPAEVLSGGERRMLALARALLSPHAVLLLDEPTTGLAPDAAARLVEALRARARAGAALVLFERTRSEAATRVVPL